MRVRVASTAGFCWGVRRAFDKVLGVLGGKDPVHTIGPLVHNEKAIQMLERRGLRTCSQPSEISDGTLVIRAHGIPPTLEEELRSKGLTVVDATCPHVKRIQRKVEEGASAGLHVCIVGYSDHPEVEALAARAGSNFSVVSSVAEVETIPADGPLLLVSQSTFNSFSFAKIRDAILQSREDVTVFNSICRSTAERQNEVRELARGCDAVVVVGSHQSSNTQRLVEIAREEGTPTYHVTSSDELNIEEVTDLETVGVTAGASTPNWVTRGVIEALTEKDNSRSVIRRILRGCIESSIYIACAAAVLTVTACLMQGIEPTWIYAAAAFCYIFSIYTLIRLQRSTEEIASTKRVAFIQSYPKTMTVAGVLFASTAFGLSLWMGIRPAILVGASYFLGIVYGIRVPSHGSKRRYERLQDIPASKDIFEAAAWTVICCIVPFLHARGLPFGLPSFIVATFVFSTIFAKATMYDSVDIQGDRVLGKETLPALLGERRTWAILWILTATAACAILLLCWLLSSFRPLPLILGPLYAGCYIPFLSRGSVTSENMNTLILNGQLFLLGLVAFLVLHT